LGIVRRRGLAVGIGIVAAASVASFAHRAATDGCDIFLGESDRVAIVVSALRELLPDRQDGQGEAPIYLHTSDQALTLAALAKLAESGRADLLPLVQRPSGRFEIISVSRINSWWPSTADLRLTSYTGIDSPGYEYRFRRVAGRWEKTGREPVSRP
jgi:hypothetical protein